VATALPAAALGRNGRGDDSLGRVTDATTTSAPSVPAGPERTDRLQLAVVAAAGFVTWAGFGAILPYLPLFLQEQAHASLGLIGVVAAGYAVGTFLFSSLLGRLSDTIGRKRIMVSGVWLYAVSSFLFVVTTHPGWFIVFRLLEGIGAAAVGPAGQAFIADITPPDRRSQAYGWLTSAQFGGLVAGPALAVPLYALGGGHGAWGYYAIFLFGSALSAVTAVALMITIKESEHAERARRQRVRRPPLRQLVTPPIVAFIVVAFTGNYAMGAFDVIWSIYLKDVGVSKTWISLTWVAFSVPMLFSWVGGRIADRGNRYQLMFWGFMFSAFSWIVYGITKNLFLFMLVNVLEGVAIALSYPAKTAFLVQVSPRRWLGTITGLEATSMQLATLLGSLTAPLLYAVIHGHVMSVSGGLAMVGLLAAAPTLRRAWATCVASGEKIKFAEAETLAVEQSGEQRATAAGPGQLGERSSV
jgi:MFS family permease